MESNEDKENIKLYREVNRLLNMLKKKWKEGKEERNIF